MSIIPKKGNYSFYLQFPVKAKMFKNKVDTRGFCQMMITDLHEAAKSDGIVMKSSSEWIYLELAANSYPK